MATIQELIQAFDKTKSKETYRQLVGLLKTQETLWVARSVYTGSCYLGTEREQAAAYAFSEKEYYEKFQEWAAQQKIQVVGEENHKQHRDRLWEEMYLAGAEVLIVDNGQTYLGISLDQLIEKKKGVIQPQGQPLVLNHELGRATNTFFQALGQKTQANLRELESNMFQEMKKASYLVPIAEMGGEAEEKGQREMTFPILKDKEDKPMLPVFTNWAEFVRYDPQKKLKGGVFTFENIMELAEKVGMVILNPFGVKLLLNPERLKVISQSKPVEKGAQAAAPQQPVQVPVPLMKAVAAISAQNPQVKAAWLRLMERDGKRSWLVVLDCPEEGREEIFHQVSLIASPTVKEKGAHITLMPLDHPVAQEATKGVPPFYQRQEEPSDSSAEA